MYRIRSQKSATGNESAGASVGHSAHVLFPNLFEINVNKDARNFIGKIYRLAISCSVGLV